MWWRTMNHVCILALAKERPAHSSFVKLTCCFLGRIQIHDKLHRVVDGHCKPQGLTAEQSRCCHAKENNKK